MADPRVTGPNPLPSYETLTRRQKNYARRQHFTDRTNRQPKKVWGQDEAIVVARMMENVVAYCCRYCGAWHVGHGRKGRGGRPGDSGVDITPPKGDENGSSEAPS